jgi:hypothetical protein
VTDLWLLVLGVGFFAIAALFVVFCDRIIGPDEDVATGDADIRAAAEEETTGAVTR